MIKIETIKYVFNIYFFFQKNKEWNKKLKKNQFLNSIMINDLINKFH